MTSYTVRPGNGDFAVPGNDLLDELRRAAAWAPRPVEVRTVPQSFPHSYTDWSGLFLLCGWAFLLGLVIAGIASALLPRFRGILFTSTTGPAG